jgi:hypothetical protein
MSNFRLFRLWFAWRVFGWPSVVLIDYDGEANPRMVRGTDQFKFANRWSFISVPVRLLPEGQTEGPCYVTRWEPLMGSVVSSTTCGGARE